MEHSLSRNVKKMRKFLLTIFNLISVVFVIGPADSYEVYEPLILKMEKNAFDVLQIPTTRILSPKDEDAVLACPARKTDQEKYLESLFTKFDQVKNCLFQKKVDEDKPTMPRCAEDVKPVLLKKYDHLTNKPAPCGNLPEYETHQFGFYFCGPESTMARLHIREYQIHPGQFIKPLFLPIYELCIDVKNKATFWTKHMIMTPEIFDEIEKKEFQHEYETDPEISTDALIFSENHFKDLKQKYVDQDTKKHKVLKQFWETISVQKKSKGFHKMEETFIVPKEHVALPMWRKTVNHYINVAPFWDENSALMTDVNNRIKKLALNLHKSNQRLTIYTKVGFFGNSPHSFHRNVWIKLLYEEKTKSAAWIILLNTPNDTSIEIPCERKMSCKSMIEDWNKYAYCCYPTMKEVLDRFRFYLEVAQSLNL